MLPVFLRTVPQLASSDCLSEWIRQISIKHPTVPQDGVGAQLSLRFSGSSRRIDSRNSICLIRRITDVKYSFPKLTGSSNFPVRIPILPLQ
jgi:hypothetical protein